MGTLLAVVVVFALLVVITQSLGYYRGRLSVADAEASGGTDVRRSAAIGASAGIAVLFLVALLYLGATQWEWFGRPGSAPATFSPAPVASPAPAVGIGASPAAGPSASPSPAK